MREEKTTSAYRIRRARSFMMLLLCVVAGTLILSKRCEADMAERSQSSRAAAADAAVISNAVKGVSDETPTDVEPVTITPTPMNQQEIQNRKTYVMEKYALGVILASGITIGMLIVLFLYWNRKAGGDRF